MPTTAALEPCEAESDVLEPAVKRLHGEKIRVSLFVEPEAAAIRWARELGADRIELYTEPYARAHERSAKDAAESFARFAEAAELAHSLGLGVNAGHEYCRPGGGVPRIR